MPVQRPEAKPAVTTVRRPPTGPRRSWAETVALPEPILPRPSIPFVGVGGGCTVRFWRESVPSFAGLHEILR